MDLDFNYTDKPFVYDVERRVRVPRNGFKGCGNTYAVDDAWLAEGDMARYAVSPAEVLQLKTCFDRINRRSKKETNLVSSATAKGNDTACSPRTRYWREKRERLRTLFNDRYLRLRQLAIRTRYRYNMRNYIVTPPITQCTHHYDTVLRRLCRLDGLPPHELQTKRVYVQRDKNWGSAYSTAAAKANAATKSRTAPSRLNNASLQKFWKTLNDTELVNKSIKDQTQGGKSFLKQVVIPGKMLNCLYGKVLPDPTLRPDEIGIPCHVMEGAFRDVDMNKVAAIVKRDPVFSSDAITTFTRVVRNPYPYITLPSEIITNKQLDFDGDNVSIMMVHSGRCFIETLMRLSAKIAMYCYFSRTRLTFSQTNGFRIGGFLRHIREVASVEREDELEEAAEAVAATKTAATGSDEETVLVEGYFGKTFAHCRYRAHPTSNVSQQLSETLLSLSQQYGPFVAFGFVMNTRALSFTGYNAGRVYPMGPDAKSMSMEIAESGSKGTKEAVERMFDVSPTRESRSAETLEYAKTFIEAKNQIRKQGHNAKKMDSAFQNIVVNHDGQLTIRVGGKEYPLGPVTGYIQPQWVMSVVTTRCIIEDVREDEDAFRRIATGDVTATPPHADRNAATAATAKAHSTSTEVKGTRSTARERLLRDAPFFRADGAGASGVSSTQEDECDDIYHYWDSVIEEVLYSNPGSSHCKGQPTSEYIGV